MQQFQFWTIDSTYNKIKLAKPRLASWNAKSDPQQIALQRYLDDIEQKLNPLPEARTLFLHMEIDVEEREHLLHNYDLDNYLYPVVQRLGSSRFRLVTAIKRIGGGSCLYIGQTKPLDDFPEKEDWISFQHDTGGISASKPEWKGNIRSALKTYGIHPLKPGTVELQLVWRCSSRNWVNLWKPTIDAMGPMLGEPNPNSPFSPDDGRIVSLTLHLNIDDSIGYAVHIGMMGRALGTKQR